MAEWTISQVARQAGLRPSAIRYYERIGLLPPAARRSGQRRYDRSALHRLALIQGARSCGLRLDEIQQLLTGFGAGTSPRSRWRAVAGKKVAELGAILRQVQAMRDRIVQIETRCRCSGMEECGRAMYRAALSGRGGARG